MMLKQSSKNARPVGIQQRRLTSIVMSINNQQTLASYEDNVVAYIEGTPQEVSGDVKKWIDETLNGLPVTSKILEVGSAFGRDASYIESKGYSVQRSDATIGFIDYLEKKEHKARVLNVIKDDIEGKFDLIFADAVLLHFTRNETVAVIKKIYNALNSGGRFSFSLKRGEGDEWSDAKLKAPRYFCYWEADNIKAILEQTRFTSVVFSEGSLGRNNGKWLHIIAIK